MNTLIAVSIAPVGIGEELVNEVAQVIKVIRDSKLSHKTSAMFTEIEGPYDEVMETVKKAIQVLTDQGIRTVVTIKMDIRPGHTDTLNKKVEKVNQILGEE